MRKITLPCSNIPYSKNDKAINVSNPSSGLLQIAILLWLVIIPYPSGTFPQPSQALPFHLLPGFPLSGRDWGEAGVLWPITIITQPSDILDCEDHVVSFKVVISGGTEPITYTWQRKRPAEGSFTDIPAGAPNITYPAPGTIRVVNVGGNENPGGTRFRVVVSDYGGSITSDPALLTVNEITDIIPSIAFPLKTNVIICQGTNFSYTVTTAGTPPVTYQWKKYVSPGVWQNVTNNSVISGSQSSVLSFTGPTSSESGQYKVNITFHSSGADCQVQSDTRTRLLTIESNVTAPVITNDITVACQGLTPEPLEATAAGGGSGSFLYQWESSPDNIIWSAISGATARTYQPPLPSSACWYRIKATDNGQVPCGSAVSSPVQLTVTDCNNLHYRTKKEGLWNDRKIWETSPDGTTWGGTAYTYPTASMLSTTIRDGHPVTVTGNIPVDRVTVDPGGAVTVAAGATLNNTGSASGFVINSSGTASGSLVDHGVFSGLLTWQRYLEPLRWYIIAAPVKVTFGFGINNSRINFSAAKAKYYLGWYKEEGNEGWIYYPSLPDALDPGRGYVIQTAVTNTPEEGIISFSGTMNGTANDTVSLLVYRTATRHGWNALGNPFTSAIGATASAVSAENFLVKNADILEDTYAAVYIWNQTGPFDGSQQYYKAIGNSGYNYEGFSYYGGDDPDYLQAGQGFLINVKATAKAVFSKSMQVHLPQAGMKSAQVSWPGLTLVATKGTQVRRTVVAFHDGMTTGLDKTYDAGLLPSDNFQIYTRLVEDDAGRDLEIQCLPDGSFGNLTVPVGLDLPQGGNVTFKVAGVILPEGWIPVLEDRLQQVSVPLHTENDSCLVTVASGTYGTGRFYLRFGKITLADKIIEKPSCSAWWNDGKILISGNIHPGSRVTLFDLNGRQLGRFPLQNDSFNEITTGRLAPGMYLLRIEDKRGVQVVKVACTGN